MMIDPGPHEDPFNDDDPDPCYGAAVRGDIEALMIELDAFRESIDTISIRAGWIAQHIDTFIEEMSNATNTPRPSAARRSGQRGSGVSSSPSDSSDQSASPF